MIRAGYHDRPNPEYFTDDQESVRGIVWQPDVYADAARIAERLNVNRLIDVGCGTGGKLEKLFGQLDVVGIDIGPNIEHCQREFRFGTWVSDDLDQPGVLPVDAQDAVIVCADVIEHMRDPSVLLSKLHHALARAAALLVSTPERDLVRSPSHTGPPENPAHVQEWNVREFGALMRRAGFAYGTIGLTRNNDRQSEMSTILGVYAPSAELRDRIEEVLIDSPWSQPPPELRRRMAYGLKHALERRKSVVLRRIGM